MILLSTSNPPIPYDVLWKIVLRHFRVPPIEWKRNNGFVVALTFGGPLWRTCFRRGDSYARRAGLVGNVFHYFSKRHVSFIVRLDRDVTLRGDEWNVRCILFFYNKRHERDVKNNNNDNNNYYTHRNRVRRWRQTRKFKSDRIRFASRGARWTRRDTIIISRKIPYKKKKNERVF